MTKKKQLLNQGSLQNLKAAPKKPRIPSKSKKASGVKPPERVPSKSKKAKAKKPRIPSKSKK
ncbi:MAG: hypothetical protein IPJ02_15905 [Chitinophagaceae bacterium]|nr:hypothetical protein [Chitinophagaceae bacterium]